MYYIGSLLNRYYDYSNYMSKSQAMSKNSYYDEAKIFQNHIKMIIIV